MDESDSLDELFGVEEPVSGDEPEEPRSEEAEAAPFEEAPTEVMAPETLIPIAMLLPLGAAIMVLLLGSNPNARETSTLVFGGLTFADWITRGLFHVEEEAPELISAQNELIGSYEAATLFTRHHPGPPELVR